MVRQITLDGIQPNYINIFKSAGEVRVEAGYAILAGAEEVRRHSRDITTHLLSSQLTAISEAYDAVFARIEQVELE